jgi:hypothetical protein
MTGMLAPVAPDLRRTARVDFGGPVVEPPRGARR